MVSIHTMDYIDAAMAGTLSPHISPVMDLKKMLSHTEETLPSTLHLPVSSEYTLHFYQYLCMHVLIAKKQFRIIHNNFPSTKFSFWISHMVILQPAMPSVLNIL